MRAMVLREPGADLELTTLPAPVPKPGEILIDVTACGVCRTDLHIVDGELPDIPFPVIPGHEIVGRISGLGGGASQFEVGQRVGVPWLGHTCGTCPYCRMGHENLCDHPEFTGYTRPGGYADQVAADARYCFALPEGYPDLTAAPLLCAGLIGYRTLMMAGSEKLTGASRSIGIYGFGAAAHVVAQIARAQGQRIAAFVRPGDENAVMFARDMGCHWAGGSDEPAPWPLDAALIFAPVGALVPKALQDVRKGGIVVCGGIHMSDVPAFPYSQLWNERKIFSVANLTRADGQAFLALVSDIPIHIESVPYPLEKANQALADLRQGRLRGAAVLDLSL